MTLITKQQILDGFKYRAATRYYDPERKVSREDMQYLLNLLVFHPVLWVLNLGSF